MNISEQDFVAADKMIFWKAMDKNNFWDEDKKGCIGNPIHSLKGGVIRLISRDIPFK